MINIHAKEREEWKNLTQSLSNYKILLRQLSINQYLEEYISKHLHNILLRKINRQEQ